MPDLGHKHECFKCGTKFYDLRKLPVLCPKCHADQKEAPPLPTSPAMLHAARRAKRDEFADPDFFDRGRDDEETPGGVPEEDLPAKALGDEEELPLGESPLMEVADSEDQDDY